MSETENVTTIKMDSIVFDPDIYPRDLTQHPDTESEIERFSEIIQEGRTFPPILLDQNRRLLDGYKRWKAHEKARRKEIEVIFRPVKNNFEAFKIACETNASGIMSLTRQERRDAAYKLYQELCELNGFMSIISETEKEMIAVATGLSFRTIERVTKEIRETIREKRTESLINAGQNPLREVEETTGIPKSTLSYMKKSLNKVSLSNLRQMSAVGQEGTPPATMETSAQDHVKLAEELGKYGMPFDEYREMVDRIGSAIKTYKRVRADIYDGIIPLIMTVPDKSVVLELYNMVAPLIKQDREYHAEVGSKVNLGDNVEQLDIRRNNSKIASASK